MVPFAVVLACGGEPRPVAPADFGAVRPRRPVTTFSIVARDPSTGEIGVAVQSHWFSVGSTVTWAEAGVGAVATQSFVEPAYGPRGLALMKRGLTAPQALRALVEVDPGEAVRQVAFVDASGEVAAHTGASCIESAGHHVGPGYSVQANMMANDRIVPAMAQAYEGARGELPERLLAALEAAQKAGGDIRGRQSAALLVVAAVVAAAIVAAITAWNYLALGQNSRWNPGPKPLGCRTMLPETMKAVLLTGHGGLEKLEVRDDVPVPKPAAGEVLLEVSACGMNNTDVWVREGAYGREDDPDAVSTWRRGRSTLTFPRIQGTDTVGRIAAVGDGVSPDRVGERVMVDFSIYNRDDDSLADIDYIGHGRDGGYAEFTAVPADHAHRVETPMSDAELATFCCAYLTGEHMLDRARVAAGERVLVTGASGGVGSGIIQLCRARGAVPYAVTSAGKADQVRAIGAEGVVLRDSGDLVAAVREVTGGAAIDVVADLVAGPMFNDLLRILRPEGRYTTSGAIAGPVVPLDLRTMYLKHLELHGSSQGTRAAFRRLVGYIEQGKIQPLLAGTYKLSEFHRAQTDFMNKKFVGKLVVVPDSKWDEVGAAHAA